MSAFGKAWGAAFGKAWGKLVAEIPVTPPAPAVSWRSGGSITPRRVTPVIHRPVEDDEAFILLLL